MTAPLHAVVAAELDAIRRPARAHTLSRRTGLTVAQVNSALSYLQRLGRASKAGGHKWVTAAGGHEINASVLAALASARGWMTPPEIARALSLKRAQVSAAIGRLDTAGKIEAHPTQLRARCLQWRIKTGEVDNG